MARKIIRRRKVAKSSVARQPDSVRPSNSLPAAKPLPSTRVMIAAPGPMRTILTAKLSSSPDVQLAGIAENEVTAVEKVLTEEADVAAVYIHLGGELAGLDVARKIATSCPEAGVLVMVNDLAGVDVRRHARRFGVAWSYAVAENVESGTKFLDLVQSVGRGIHWIDPELKRLLEAIWQVAEQGRDMEGSKTAQRMLDATLAGEVDEASGVGGIQTMRVGAGGIGSNAHMASDASVTDDVDEDGNPVKPRGIQSMQAGRGGIGSGGFGVSKAG